jgi:hypothetical protein
MDGWIWIASCITEHAVCDGAQGRQETRQEIDGRDCEKATKDNCIALLLRGSAAMYCT